MTRRPIFLVAMALVTCAGCQGEGAPSPAGSSSAPSPSTSTPTSIASAPTIVATSATTAATTTSVAATTATNGPATTATIGQPGAQSSSTLTLTLVAATSITRAEDGTGAVVEAKNPVFLDVRGGVGGQALGPELAFGQLRFREHRYPSPGVVRFTCADRSLLPAGADVALVYGSKRVAVAKSAGVP